MRLLAESTIAGNVDTTLGISFDNGERYILHIRKAICELIENASAADVSATANAVSLTKDTETKLIYADVPNADPDYMQTLQQLMASGAVPVTKGTPAGVLAFFKHFQPAPTSFPPLAGR
jgi:hypothetical protein